MDGFIEFLLELVDISEQKTGLEVVRLLLE